MSRESDAGRLAWRHYLLLAGQLVLATWVISRFQIESRAFARLSLLVLVGFLVHARLPLAWRPPTFTLLGLGGIVLVLGTHNAVWVIGLGGLLIGVGFLPLSNRWRLVVALVLGGVLALFRTEVLAAPWSSAIWPVLGALFALRMIVFLYDRSHGVGQGSFWHTLSYFFTLPNVCFALLPVVDYKTYLRSYYSEPAWKCHQTGMAWITRGLVQLLLYRYIYYYVVLAPTEVETTLDLVRYVTSNYALYLRVSGAFHLIVGMVRLFGFALPETNFLYFLSSSVNDFWRRANIYWKDFMLKVFYYPTFFRLRRGGERRAFVLSTLAVVLVTWWLHSYQWFWLRGDFPLRWQDGIFWTVLGLMMIANTLYERGHVRARGRRARGRGFDGRRVLAVVATFSFMAVLWSLWTCESFADWAQMWSAIGRLGADGTSRAGVAPLGIVAVVVLAAGRMRSWMDGLEASTHRAATSIVVLSALLALSAPPVYTRLGETTSEVVQSLRVAKLNRLDAERLQRGYYEDLLDVDRFNTELWSVFRSKPTGWRELHETNALGPRDDFLLNGLVADTRVPYKGATLVVNRWGQRDRDYALEKPAGTKRIAVLGGSYVMGAGVENEETFENLVERRLGETFGEGRFEVLNFGVGGYSAVQRLRSLEVEALRFSPDVAVYVAHENEHFRLGRLFEAARRRGIEPPYAELRALLERAGVEDAPTEEAYEARLEPYFDEILDFVYRRFVDICRQRGIEPVWVFLPTLEMHGEAADVEQFERAAQRAGFETISLFGLWHQEGLDLFALRVADWDYHPNAEGHRLIAAALYDELMALPVVAGHGTAAPETQSSQGDDDR